MWLLVMAACHMLRVPLCFWDCLGRVGSGWYCVAVIVRNCTVRLANLRLEPLVEAGRVRLLLPLVSTQSRW